MPALKFSTMVGKATVFQPFRIDPNFSHFIFQPANPDDGNRKTFHLIIYAVYQNASTPKPVDPPASDWKAVSAHPLSNKIVLGNLKLNKDKLIGLFEKNPRVAYFGFKAEGLGTGNQDRYVQYKVYPCKESGDPNDSLVDFTTFLDPSPPA